MSFYCGIGSRETPKIVLDLMTQCATTMEQVGWCLRSGGAPGADDAFERGCQRMHIYLPWSPFNNRVANGLTHMTIPEEVKEEAYRIARQYHPNWEALSRGGQGMMARNVLQVLGHTLQIPASLIICWTPEGRVTGGTGQALRMARDYGVEVVNYGLYYKQ